MIGKKTDEPRRKRLQTMALSLLLAVIVWFMVMSLTNPGITTTVSNLNVRFVGERDLREKQLAITGRANIPQLSAVVSGNRSDLMNHMDDIYVQIDVSGIDSAGEYNLTGTISVPTTRISVERENYSEIPITVEAVASKDIEVTVKQTGTLKNKIVGSVADNPIVRITGAESEINSVAGAVATIDISQLTDNNRQRVSYLLTDSSGSLISGNETLESTRSEVEITNTVYDAKTLPVEPVLTPELERQYTLNKDKTSVSPSTVTVGVSDENTDDRVIVIIDRLSEDGGQEYPLQSSDGMYIPPENRLVSVKAQLDSKAPEPPPENGENPMTE